MYLLRLSPQVQKATSCQHRAAGLERGGRGLLVEAFVLSRIDYCNAVLAALPRSTIEPLQRVQNAAARLVFGLRSHDHITPALAYTLVAGAVPH